MNTAAVKSEAARLLCLPVESLPAEINKLVSDAEHHAGAAFAAAMLAGQLLRLAKSKVQHGEWEAWITSNCTLSVRTAQAYMRLAERVQAMPEHEAQRVALLPLREAIKAICTTPTAPPRLPSEHRPSRDRRERAAAVLTKAADAQRALIRRIGMGYIKRAEVERTRLKLQAALAALDALQVADDALPAAEVAA